VHLPRQKKVLVLEVRVWVEGFFVEVDV